MLSYSAGGFSIPAKPIFCKKNPRFMGKPPSRRLCRALLSPHLDSFEAAKWLQRPHRAFSSLLCSVTPSALLSASGRDLLIPGFFDGLGRLQDSPLEKSCTKIGPQRKRKRLLREPIPIIIFSFLCRRLLHFPFKTAIFIVFNIKKSEENAKGKERSFATDAERRGSTTGSFQAAKAGRQRDRPKNRSPIETVPHR